MHKNQRQAKPRAERDYHSNPLTEVLASLSVIILMFAMTAGLLLTLAEHS